MESSSNKVPPTEILNIKNFEHIILWMLKNNDSCQWSDFVSDPVSISGSTLSGYLNNLKEDGYIDKAYHIISGRKRKVYIITPEGKRRFNKLSTYQSEQIKLNYPPNIILNRRNYDHWILWMVYNNTSCKWSDFLGAPLNINQSSLSKNLNQLMSQNLVSKDEDEKTYSITQSGRMAYSQMLRKYDLDRQSILEEESKRIEEIVGKIKNFFAGKRLTDDIKYRFITNILKLDYSKIQEILPNENDFFKIILFISINHPSVYPEYVSLTKFTRDYNIKERILNYYIPEIVENELYPIKFFNLTVESGKDYYFRSDDDFERNLRVLVDDCIMRLTYLNKLYKGTPEEIPESNFYDQIIQIISEKATRRLIPEELQPSLKSFLPKYISHLLYKFDTEVEIKKTLDKSDAFAYDKVSQIFQAIQQVSEEEENYYVDPMIFKLLKPIKECKLELLKQQLFEWPPKEELMELIDSALKVSPKDIELKQLKAIILCILRKYDLSITFLEKEINYDSQKLSKDDYINTAFILAYANIGTGLYDKAGEIRGEVLKKYPKEMLSGLLNAFIYAYNIIYQFDPKISTEDEFHYMMKNLIEREQDNVTKSELYEFYSQILHLTENNKEAVQMISRAVEINPTIQSLFSKAHYLIDSGSIDEGITLLKYIGNKFPEKMELTKFKIATMYYKLDKLSESKALLEEIIERNPDNLDYLNSYIYLLAKLNLREETIKQAEHLIKRNPDNGNYFDSYGEILMNFENYEEAINKFNKALELNPEDWFVYETYIKLGRCQMKLGYNEEAIENFHKGKSFINRNLPCCKKHFTWIEKADQYLEQLNAT